VKFGVYEDDRDAFEWIREGAPAGKRCVEAQVMDLADDIAYSVHDLEDGIVAGRIDLEWLDPASERREVWETTRDWYLPDVDDAHLEEAVARLRASPSWPRSPYDGSRGSLAALKNLTSELIGRFCTAVEAATHEAFGSGPITRYAGDVVIPEETLTEISVLKGISAHYVMQAEERQGILQRQREIVTELVSVLRQGGPDHLEPAFRLDHEAAGDDAARLRVVIDQVASLTDASALKWHARLR
jgi:dGTPase